MRDLSLEESWTFHTSGSNCHWCLSRAASWVWGPYGTNVCSRCQSLIEAGNMWQVIESQNVAHGDWVGVDPDEWRKSGHALLAWWLEVRTVCRPRSAAEGQG